MTCVSSLHRAFSSVTTPLDKAASIRDLFVILFDPGTVISISGEDTKGTISITSGSDILVCVRILPLISQLLRLT